MENMIINKLPVKTWHFLNVNEAKLAWDEENTTVFAKEKLVPENNCLIETGTGFSEKACEIFAKEASKETYYITQKTSGNLRVSVNIKAEKNSEIKLVQFLNTEASAVLVNSVTTDCDENANIEVIQIILGGGNVYTETRTELNGKKSFFTYKAGYLAKDSQLTDINVISNHYGKDTGCQIDVSGALLDSAKKVFRGTIDFKNGCANAEGHEQENVLMLGDDVQNLTVPLILCAEENVVGTHGATIGELDADTLFYFESRGIEKAEAENIMARAYIERTAAFIENEAVRAAVSEKLAEVLSNE